MSGVEARQEERGEQPFSGHWWGYRPIQSAIVAGILLALGFTLSRLGLVPEWAAIALYMAAIPLGAFYWAREGYEEFVHERVIGNEALMAAATLGAAILGAWEEAAFLVFLYGSAEAVEEYTFARTRTAIRALLDLAPKEAHVLRDGQEVVMPAAALQPGDVFVARPGEGIATDGVIREGHAAIDEAAVTGESIPVEKGPDDRVFAGTINRTGSLKVEAITRFEDNTLSKIIRLVEEAQEKKSQAQLFIERFGRRYSPLVLLGALLLLAVPPLVGLPFREWAVRAITLLVAGAPCALVMSTPVAVAAAIGRAGRDGVLVKGGMPLEGLGQVRVVAMDKTGTLTRGEPMVTDVIPLDEREAAEVLRLAASVEYLSEHPLAWSIVRRAQEEEVRLLPAQDFRALVGAGAVASVDGREVSVGSPSLFEKLGLDVGPVRDTVERLQAEGKTVVLVGDHTRLEGVIAIRDQVRPVATTAIRELHALGIKVVMLTGDNRRTAQAIAKELGIDEVHAELKPEDKVRLVEDLRKRYGYVAMVGDGVNDAPALAAATVGIAMGAAGTDAAIEAADVALMADDLQKVAYATRLGKRAQSISRQNIAFSLLVLAVLIPGAVLGLFTVALAVLAHEVSELLAVANGLRVVQIPRD